MPNNSISEITSYFSRGFQKVNRFEVTFSRGNAKFWASECQIPEQAVEWFQDTTMSPSGPTIQIPVKREYDKQFLISFIVETGWQVRKYFETWIDGMFSPLLAGKSKTMDYRNGSGNLSNITIKAIGEDSAVNATFILYEAFPKLILPSQFSNDVPNQYLSLMVDFNYRYYRLM